MNSLSDFIAQYLVPEEQLLFSTEKVQITPHLTQKQRIVGVKYQMDTNRLVINGAMAITDRRIIVLGTEGVFSKKPALKFEAIFDSDYAKQFIETTKTKNEEIIQQSQDMGFIARTQFMKEQGHRTDLKILTGVNFQEGLIGGGNLVLQIFTVYMSREGQKLKNIGRMIGKIATYGTVDMDKAQFELRIQRPMSLNLSMSKQDAMEGMLRAGNIVMYGILKLYKGKTDVTYGPLLDIMKAKSQEIAGLVKELEASAV